jgi:hypothetical protein
VSDQPTVHNTRAQRLPAFPAPEGAQARGADLRDLMAMSALQGMLARGADVGTPDMAADYAYDYADAMMRRRAR